MMSQPPHCRVLIENEPGSGTWNMAVDEVLLEAALHTRTMQVRWYRWSEATLSLGYFQPAADPDETPATTGLPRVRRLSGGGAILHHHEWTCSVALPPEHPLAATPAELYSLVHRQVVRLLRDAGVPAALRQDATTDSIAAPAVEAPPATNSTTASSDQHTRPPEPFLCFGRGDPRDIVLAGWKIMGSAQRRRKGAVLQHGSLLLRRSPYAPDFPGVCDLHPEFRFEPDDIRRLTGRIVSELSGTAAEEPVLPASGSDTFTATERERIAELASTRYSQLEWHRRSNRRRSSSPVNSTPFN